MIRKKPVLIIIMLRIRQLPRAIRSCPCFPYAWLFLSVRFDTGALFRSGLEDGRLLRLDLYGIAGSRVAAGARVATTHRERAEAAQFDPIAPCERARDLLEDRGDDTIDVPLIQMRVSFGEAGDRSEEHTSELQSLLRISYAVFCLKKINTQYQI